MPLSQKAPEPVPSAGVAIPTGSTLAAIMVVYGLIAVVLLSINLPPFQNPDELTHFFRAEHISRGNLIGQRFDTYKSGGLVEKNIFPAHAPFAEIPTSPDVKLNYDEYARAGEVRWSGEGQMVNFPNTANYPPFLYTPSVIGIWIGKLADLSILQTLYLSRLLSGMVSVAVGAAAIALAGTFGPWLFAMLLLPMSLSQMAAVSQDGLMFSLAALSAAIIARAMIDGPISIRFFRLLVLCLALISMARPPYAALALLVPAVPGFRRATRMAGAGMVAASAILWTLLAAAVSQVPLVRFDIIPDPGAQIGFLLESPSRIVSVAAQTLDAYWVHYRQQFIGQLGWLEVTLPNSYYSAAWVALLVAFIASLPVAGGSETGRSGWALDHAGRFGRHLLRSGPFRDPVSYLDRAGRCLGGRGSGPLLHRRGSACGSFPALRSARRQGGVTQPRLGGCRDRPVSGDQPCRHDPSDRRALLPVRRLTSAP